MVTLKVQKIEKMDLQAENAVKLDVTVELYDGETLLEERRLNFPLETSQDQLKTELESFVNTYNHDRELSAANAQKDAAHKAADETIAALTGTTVEVTANPVSAPTDEATPSTEAPADVAQTETPAEVAPVNPEVPAV